MMPETSIRGVALWNVTREELLETACFIESMATSSKLHPVLGEAYALENASSAHVDTLEKTGCIGKKYFVLWIEMLNKHIELSWTSSFGVDFKVT